MNCNVQTDQSGIHSYPLVPWDGVGQPSPEPNPNLPGFCNHNLVTFPTWHRPYMLLYEVSKLAMRGYTY